LICGIESPIGTRFSHWQRLSIFAIGQAGEFVMATMNVSLPDPLKDWVEDRVKSGRYANASDYVRDLIRRDQERRDGLVRALIEGERSGTSKRTIREIVAAAKSKL
jgi:antitoxin ParD1/3/4